MSVLSINRSEAAPKKATLLRQVYHENLWVVGKRHVRIRHDPHAKRASRLSLVALIVLSLSFLSLLAGAYWYQQQASNYQQWLQLSEHIRQGMRDSTTVYQALARLPSGEPRDVRLRRLLYRSQGLGEAPGTIDLDDRREKGRDTDHGRIERYLSGGFASSVSSGVNPGTPIVAGATMQDYSALSMSGYQLAELFGLAVRTIVIDPGHGGRDPGAVGRLGVLEKDVALHVALELQRRLQARGAFNVMLTRERDRYVSLSERVAFANEHNADLFLSIHINYFEAGQGNKSLDSFVETYYFGPTADKQVAQLAARENKDSHYPYAHFKDMLQKIGDTMKFQESRDLAKYVHSHLYERLRGINQKAADHGIKSAPFVVLLGIDAPSVLAEVTCMCNGKEEERLKSAAYRDKIALFLEQGIVNYLDNNTTLGGGRHGEEEKLAQAK